MPAMSRFQIPEDVSRLGGALSYAETGSFDNPWIRTTSAPAAGSTAFGPRQLTYSTAKDYVTRGLVSPESGQFFRTVMEPMYVKFNKYGREPQRPGYSPQYDYGGTGGFDSKAHAAEYFRLADEVLAAMYKQVGGDQQKTIEKWRGKPRSADPAYFRRVQEMLPNL